jgi:hypothetical protein
MKARSGYQERAIRRTCRAVMLGSTSGHVAMRHATQGCAGGCAGAASPIITQVMLGHEHVDRRPRREHDDPRQDVTRRTGPRRATYAPHRGSSRATASCAWARPLRAAPGHAERRGRAGPGGARGGGSAPCHGCAVPRARGRIEDAQGAGPRHGRAEQGSRGEDAPPRHGRAAQRTGPRAQHAGPPWPRAN